MVSFPTLQSKIDGSSNENYAILEGLEAIVASSLHSDATARALSLLNCVVFIDLPSNYHIVQFVRPHAHSTVSNPIPTQEVGCSIYTITSLKHRALWINSGQIQWNPCIKDTLEP